MKTTILDEMDLPDEVKAAARLEALRRGVPVSKVLSEWVVNAARRLTEASMEPVEA